MVYVRRDEFRSKFPDGRIVTELVEYTDDRAVFKAFVYRNFEEDKPFATGHAEESRTSKESYGKPKSFINEANHIENCETSAIGRALENAGFSKGGDQIPSFQETAREMVKSGAVTPKKQEDPKPDISDGDVKKTVIKQMYGIINGQGHDPKEMTIKLAVALDKGSLGSIPTETLSNVLGDLKKGAKIEDLIANIEANKSKPIEESLQDIDLDKILEE